MLRHYKNKMVLAVIKVIDKIKYNMVTQKDEYLLRATNNFCVIIYFILSMTFLTTNTILFL